ncbi:MAG: 5-formyltetrahydrofolate cyclo-ligase [Flavobacterium sp.]|jgi:5-formyltetrahydrofolate cyclo-ligase
MTDASQTKKALRKAMRLRRKLIPHDQQKETSRRIIQQLYQFPFFKKAQHVALYWPFQGEVDVTNLVADLSDKGPNKTDKKIWYLPLVSDAHRPWERQRLIFQPKIVGDPGIVNQYGIEEPTPSKNREFNPQMLDIVLMPLLGFDRKGNRLGMGKGYYDRTFGRAWRRPKLIGLAHADQECEGLIQEDWDVSLDLIVTENESINCAEKKTRL